MRVLHVINNLTYGGAEKLLLDIVRHQRARGIHADVFCLNDKNEVYSQKDLPDDCILYYSRKKTSLYDPIHFFNLRKVASSYDLLHVHLFPSQYWVALLTYWLPSLKVITTEHNTFNSRMKYKPLHFLERSVYRRYKRIVAISEQTRQSLQSWLQLEQGYFEVIENGIELEPWQRALPIKRSSIDPCLSDEDFCLAMVGRFTEQKDHYSVLKALINLPTHYKLLLIGEGEKKEEYESFCLQNGLSGRVIFTGFRNDVPQILKSCDLAIISSHWEGFGLAAVEAMAAGIPLLASDVPGLREVVEGGGVLFEKGNVAEITSLIRKLRDDNTFRQSIILQQLEKASNFDVVTTAKKYLNLYRSL